MDTDQAQREKVFRLLTANPEIRDILNRAMDLEEEGKAKYLDHPEYYLGWQWEDIGVTPQKLRVLVEEGLITVSYHSNSSRCYRIKDTEMVREAMQVSPVEAITPADLFSHIVGHDDVKYWINKSIKSPEPVHIILCGPPATSKSLFLEGLATLPGSQYTLGGASTKAGIAEFLLYFQPRYLIIDELEKMDRSDFSVLLSLMSSGIVTQMKKGMRDTKRMAVTVYAGVNRAEHLPPELLSRFIRFNFIPYTHQEFVDVAVAVMTRTLGKDEDLARYIAERVATRTRDVRQAINLSKLIETKEELDKFYGTGLL